MAIVIVINHESPITKSPKITKVVDIFHLQNAIAFAKNAVLPTKEVSKYSITYQNLPREYNFLTSIN